MRVVSFVAIVRALNDAGVRYLIAGGMAVNAHGYLRFTHDVDIVIALDTANVLPAFAALAELGYRPLVPITAGEFANAATRGRWIAEKGMTVLGFHSEQQKAGRPRDQDDIQHLNWIREDGPEDG